nr:uncharacterized protein LOC109153306 isoform X2 [Ipomoea batatas]GME19208.1 uncharacterized protein LOC109153306 isoform X2 [Ipomoea batatas]
MTKGAFIIFTSTWLRNIVTSLLLLLKFVLSFPPENISEDDDPSHSDSENILVMGLMQKLELSKAILPLAVNLSLALYAMRSREDDEMQFVEQLVVVAFMMGASLICNGILVPQCTPTFARNAELLGMGLVISAVYLLLAIPLMWWLRIILAPCWFLCIRPFIMAGVFANNKKMVAAKKLTIMHAGSNYII